MNAVQACGMVTAHATSLFLPG